FRAVIGAAAPTGKAVSAEVEIEQILTAIRDVAQAHFTLPVDAAEDRGLGRLVILAPVVTACEKVVELGRTQRPVPTEPEHVAGLTSIVVIGVQARQSGWAARTRLHLLTVIAVVTRYAVLLTEDVIALHAGLGIGADIGPARHEVVVLDVADGSGRGTRVGFQDSVGGVCSQRF